MVMEKAHWPLIVVQIGLLEAENLCYSVNYDEQFDEFSADESRRSHMQLLHTALSEINDRGDRENLPAYYVLLHDLQFVQIKTEMAFNDRKNKSTHFDAAKRRILEIIVSATRCRQAKFVARAISKLRILGQRMKQPSLVRDTYHELCQIDPSVETLTLQDEQLKNEWATYVVFKDEPLVVDLDASHGEHSDSDFITGSGTGDSRDPGRMEVEN
ncbi:MAG: hypothetical protein MHM6MM_008014 [Cercozoa sp. M6MM]